MSRGLAWLVATLILSPLVVWQTLQLGEVKTTLPVLYTLGGDFELDSTLGDRLRLSDLEGNLVLLNFGYTGCPDVCPTALAKMRDVLGMLGERRAGVRPLFVTLDPSADTLDRLSPYVRFFDANLVGLTGSEAEIRAVADLYKVFYERAPMESEGGYSISHNSHIYLLDTQGRVRATFGEGVPAGEVAAIVAGLTEEPDLLAWSAGR